MNKSWIYLFLTSMSELLWVYGFNMAYAWWHWIIIIILILMDFQFLAKACENIPTGTVYAIFAGAGTIGTLFMDFFLFGEHLNMKQLFFIFLIVVGVIGLKLSDNKKGEDC